MKKQSSQHQVYVKMVKVRNDTVVAVCDEELLGKKFEDKKRGLKLEVKETFYKGSKMGLENCIEYVKAGSIVNLVGSRIVRKAAECGLINPIAVIVIAGVPHAQLIKM
ncbi:DUF424 domain-containing protein [Candidatus Hecatella orcuttiae]|uniref:DUF424 domain-containing protein n=1 Tax=Candidatus Hecatella orcuttiae TaxID=1935119 RepID=UPI0028683066|nr:DUF424 family protein [Candidatus Hecatella orcuttiae]